MNKQNRSEGRLTVQIDGDVAKELNQFLATQGRTAPSKSAVVSQAVIEWITAQRKGNKAA